MQFQMKASRNDVKFSKLVKLFVDFITLQWKPELVSLATSLETEESRLVGSFSSVFGPQNLGVLVWRHRHIDQAHLLSRNLRQAAQGQIDKLSRVALKYSSRREILVRSRDSAE